MHVYKTHAALPFLTHTAVPDTQEHHPNPGPPSSHSLVFLLFISPAVILSAPEELSVRDITMKVLVWPVIVTVYLAVFTDSAVPGSASRNSIKNLQPEAVSASPQTAAGADQPAGTHTAVCSLNPTTVFF